MDAINILIVEDEVILRRDLSYRLTQMGYVVTDMTDNGPKALQIYRQKPIDLALLDIHILGEWDGIETARRMRQIKQTPLIFLTALTDPATIERARLVSPSAYVTKPFTDLNLRIAIDLALHNFATQQNVDNPEIIPTDAIAADPAVDSARIAEVAGKGELILRTKEYIFIKQNYRFRKFRAADVLYLQSDGNYTDIITSETKYTLRLVLSKVLEKLQTPDIVRTHRSYAVNLRQITSFNEHEVVIGQHTIPIGRSYRDGFMGDLEFM